MSLLRTLPHCWIIGIVLAVGCLTTNQTQQLVSRTQIVCRAHLEPPEPPEGMVTAESLSTSACACEIEPELPELRALAALPEEPIGPVRVKLGIILDSHFVADAMIRHQANPPLTVQEILEHYVGRIEAEVYPIFERDFQAHFVTSYTRAFEGSDPFGTPEPGMSRNGEPWYDYVKMISLLANWRPQNIPNSADLDCVIMLTMKNYAVAGVAVGQACTKLRGEPWHRNAGIAWNYNVQVIAHEIAHQFGIGHDIDNEYFPLKYIMNTFRTVAALPRFSPRSIEHWQLFLRTRDCLEPMPGPAPVMFLRGDVNGDGRVNGVTDGLMISNYLFSSGQKPPCMDAADVNDDGKVGLTDAVRILNYQFNGGISPAPPFPEPGYDPTPDELGCDD